MKSNIKEYADSFRVFSLYLKLDYKDCRQQMKEFFRTLPNSGTKKNSDKKIDAWWDGLQKPQTSGRIRQITRIKLFYRRLAKERGFAWKSSWVVSSLEELALDKNDLLRASVRKYQDPYAIARIYKDYIFDYGQDSMRSTVERYCNKYFFIYRLHSFKGDLVCDVLKFHDHDEEKIFCNLYQYTNHYILDPKHPEWKHIKRFNGNVVHNKDFLNILLITPIYPSEKGTEFAQLVIPRFNSNTERKCLLMSFEDESGNPAAVPIYIVETNINNIDSKDMNNYVKKIDDENENEKSIRKYLSGDLGKNMMLITQRKGMK